MVIGADGANSRVAKDIDAGARGLEGQPVVAQRLPCTCPAPLAASAPTHCCLPTTLPPAGEYDYAIAFQERIRIPEDKMDYYKDLAEM